jgi:hypothetical protein
MAGKGNKESNVSPPGLGWISKLAEEVNTPFPPEGEGWMTISEIAAYLGRGLTSAATALRKAKAEKKRFSHIGVDGRRVTLVHYRVK